VYVPGRESVRAALRLIVSRADIDRILMGIECVYDATVVTVIADWTIEMVKRGPRGTSVPQPADRHPPTRGSKPPRHVLHPSSFCFFFFLFSFYSLASNATSLQMRVGRDFRTATCVNSMVSGYKLISCFLFARFENKFRLEFP